MRERADTVKQSVTDFEGPGTESAMRREFTTWSAMTLGFVLVSPIVAMYTVFGAGVGAVGPGFWWGWIIALGGQLLVAVAFGVLASRWPQAGGVYQWSRRLGGATYGWFAGWAYIWTLLIAMTAVSSVGGGFVLQMLGIASASEPLNVAIGAVLIAAAVAINVAGRRMVQIFAFACIVAEAVGSVGIAVWLLLFHRVNDLSVIGNPFNLGAAPDFASTPIVLATMIAGWTFLGFESASTLSEEVAEPKKDIPKALVGSLVGVGLVVVFTGLAILLAMPADGLSGNDPVVATLATYLPAPVFKVAMGLFVIAYVACIMAINSAVGRIVWSYGRDRELPAGRRLSSLSSRTNIPTNAVILTGLIAILLYVPFQIDELNTMLVTFVTAGFFISFSFPVLGLVMAKVRGTWGADGERTFLGAWGQAAVWGAAVWLALETVNVVWMRTGDPLVDLAPFVVTGGLVVIGFLVRALAQKQTDARS